MGKGKATTDEPVIDPELLSTAPDDWEFQTIAEESAIGVILEDVGDVFIGAYVGDEHIEPDNGTEPFDRYTFRGRDGKLYAMNQSYKLKSAFEDNEIAAGTWVRITLVKTIPSKKGNDIKDYRVDVRTN